MQTAPQELLKQYVQSQHFTSTAEIMAAMKEMFRDVIQQVGCGLVHSRVDKHHAAGKLCRIDFSDIPGLTGVFTEEIAVIERRIVFQFAELFIQIKAGGVFFQNNGRLIR